MVGEIAYQKKRFEKLNQQLVDGSNAVNKKKAKNNAGQQKNRFKENIKKKTAD